MKKIISIMLGLLFLVSCSEQRDHSVPEERYNVDIEWKILDVDGPSQILRSGRDLDTVKGSISGLGPFKSGEQTRIRINAKAGYTYKGMYFRYSSGYPEAQYPKSQSMALSSNNKLITVHGNITVIAVIEKNSSAIIDIQ